MICIQGKSIQMQGASPGAFVTIKMDHHADSHAFGIIQVKKSGRARIATIARILSTGGRKGDWWIPSDQYVLKYPADKHANIPPELEIIRQAILLGIYNDAARATIQGVHQAITESISSCRKSKCGWLHWRKLQNRAMWMHQEEL